MKMVKILFLILIISMFMLSPVFGDQHILQSGHIGIITDFKWLKSEQLFFSCDNMGLVKVWDVLTYNLVKNLRISHLPIERIEVHPKEPLLAVMVKSKKGFELLVINWKTGEELFSRQLSERPLEIKFSPRGSYLVLTQTDLQSLVVLDAKKGNELNYLKKSFGIISYFSISGSEKTIMIYTPSGKLNYIDFKSSKEKLEKPIETLPNLSYLQISQNQLFLAGSDGEKLVVVDLLTGGLISEFPLKNISAIQIAEDDKELAVVAQTGRKSIVQFFKFDGKILTQLENKLEKNQITEALYANRKFYFTDEKGRMLFADAFGREKVFSQNQLIPISDLAINPSTIAIGNAQQLILFPLDLLRPGSNKVVESSDINYQVIDNPLGVSVGLEYLRSSRLFVWSKDDVIRRFVNLNLQNGEIANEYDEFDSPLIQLDILDDKLLTLQKNGTCKIMDSISFETDFQYDAPGMHKINYVSSTTLIGARSKLSQLGSPLIKINPKTGETVPISDSSLMCYDIVYDKSSHRLYSLSVKEKNGSTETILRRHYGSNFENETTIQSYPGEDLSSHLVLDSQGRYVFTSIGYDISEWDGIKIIPYPHSEHIPRKLYLSDHILLSLNRDLSISVWNRETRLKNLDLYFFTDQSWVAITANDQVYSSEDGEKYIYKTSF